MYNKCNKLDEDNKCNKQWLIIINHFMYNECNDSNKKL